MNAAFIDFIFGTLLEQTFPQGSLKFSIDPSGNFRWAPKPAKTVALKADPSVNAWTAVFG